MANTPNITRLQMRTTQDFEKRLADLMKKKGLEKSSIVNLAVAEMHEREFPPKAGGKGRDRAM